MLQRYHGLNIPKDHVVLFQQALLSRGDAVFYEYGDVGLLYLTGVMPRFKGQIHVAFWDRKLGRDRRELVRLFMHLMFQDFQLERIEALVPVRNEPLLNMFRKSGMTLEGVIRRGWCAGPGDFCDLVVLSMLKDESHAT